MKKYFFLFASVALFLSACSSGSSSVVAKPEKFGNASAPILVEEFGDLQCPSCGLVTPQLHELIKNNPDLAKLEFYHYPLSMHEFAFPAAEASECAADQGKFWDYALMIYKNQTSLNNDYLTKVADTLGLDRAAFDQCLADRKHKDEIQAAMAEGNKREIPGTPTLFVNGKMVEWSNSDQFLAYLKSL